MLFLAQLSQRQPAPWHSQETPQRHTEMFVSFALWFLMVLLLAAAVGTWLPRAAQVQTKEKHQSQCYHQHPVVLISRQGLLLTVCGFWTSRVLEVSGKQTYSSTEHTSARSSLPQFLSGKCRENRRVDVIWCWNTADEAKRLVIVICLCASCQSNTGKHFQLVVETLWAIAWTVWGTTLRLWKWD